MRESIPFGIYNRGGRYGATAAVGQVATFLHIEGTFRATRHRRPRDDN